MTTKYITLGDVGQTSIVASATSPEGVVINQSANITSLSIAIYNERVANSTQVTPVATTGATPVTMEFVETNFVQPTAPTTSSPTFTEPAASTAPPPTNVQSSTKQQIISPEQSGDTQIFVI